MPPLLTSFYAEWRVRCGVVPLLREDQQSPPVDGTGSGQEADQQSN